MSLLRFFKTSGHTPTLLSIKNFARYIGPGLLITVGFIDPGNWATNLAAGADFGYSLLWVITLSTIMLILLQHNAARLGIATGLCLSEAATKYMHPWASRTCLATATLAAVATGLAEILGGAIALKMLFNMPIRIGAIIMTFFSLIMLFASSYKRLEKIIIGFVSIIGFAFLYELSIVPVDWNSALHGWVVPSLPAGSLPIVMGVLGAVVMPHNLFLHSEIIQSRQWNLENKEIIRKQLKFEFLDTIFSMGVGFAINSAMILLAAAVFFSQGVQVTELEEAKSLLAPLLGNGAAIVFALALLLAGISSTITAGISGGSIFSGIFSEPYDTKDPHTRIGVGITLGLALFVIFFVQDTFTGLIYSQIFLSMQLPVTIFLQIKMTSSSRVMGEYANRPFTNIILVLIGIVVTGLNIALLWEAFFG